MKFIAKALLNSTLNLLKLTTKPCRMKTKRSYIGTLQKIVSFESCVDHLCLLNSDSFIIKEFIHIDKRNQIHPKCEILKKET